MEIATATGVRSTYRGGTAHAICPANTTVYAGACNISRTENWYIRQSYMKGNGWVCSMTEDHGTDSRTKSVLLTAYAYCLK